MTITRTFTSLAVAAALAATSAVPLATSASADSGRGRHFGAPHAGRHWHSGDHHRFAYKHHHKHDKTGRIIALGLGALMLGIIASQAGRRDTGYGYSDDYDARDYD